MKKIIFLSLIMLLFFLSSCTDSDEIIIEPIIIPTCSDTFSMTLGDFIPLLSVEAPYSKTLGSLDNFANTCKPFDVNPIFMKESSIKTHQLIFSLDAIYPIDQIIWTSYIGELAEKIDSISIDVSLNGISYQRIVNNFQLSKEVEEISLGGTMASKIKITAKADEKYYGIQDVRLKLADGLIVLEDKAWSNTFLRYNGWTGADGIFTFNLTDGDESIGASKNTTGFIFSDTFVGEVYQNNKLRKSFTMINNSLGYYDWNKPFDEAFTFDYKISDNKAKSVFTPDHYIGKQARNLLDGDGLSITQSSEATLTNSTEGISWLTNQVPSEVVIDLKDFYNVGSIYLWNYNSNTSYGAKKIEISYSQDKITYNNPSIYTMNPAGGSAIEPYTLEISSLEQNARYIKIKVLESYDLEFVGLGKLMIFSTDDIYLFGQATASSHVDSLEPNENSARLWLQDGVVVNQNLYIFPILVKDESNIFKVHNVGLIKAPIVDERIDYSNSEYLDSPLQVKTQDGGTIFLGAGLMNHSNVDGYIYIYGYKDLRGRHLVVGRFLPRDIENFNAWEYFNGTDWTHDINQVHGLISKVSAELSVTYIESGLFAGKFMLVVMEDTTSGIISYSISDTPYGPFGSYNQIYKTSESTYLRAAFTYNAKLHPSLSEPGNFLISYNVNTTLVGALTDANIYYPRFIRIIEVKK
ncbi:MAG: DUF4185 domain-containing protein [Acholeplasmataceae bacterium]|nr:DUF4185 domain-containing protein [Acholeplasmataceae bacterium]